MQDAQQLTILLVDDGVADRKMLRALLLRAPDGQYSCLEAHTCAEALAICRDHVPDCILLDYQMPDMDGIIFLKKLQHEGLAHVPVILVTAFGSEPLAVHAFRTGVQDYLRKDTLTTDSLMHAIRFAVYKKQAELVLMQRDLDLRARADEMDRMNSMVTHDLKVPLTTIQVFLGYLERDIGRQHIDRAMSDIEHIRTATQRMQHLVESLLNVSRAGHAPEARETFTLQEIAHQALTALAGSIARRGVHVHVPDEQLALQGNRAELVCLFQNLIDNAVKFMGAQCDPRISIGARCSGDETVFFVRDNGGGIEPGYLEKMFVMFEKFDASAEGSGIGLALAKKIVESHGGRIWAESDGPGKGACFNFTLPVDSMEPGGGGSE